jgi:hypothetical protein
MDQHLATCICGAKGMKMYDNRDLNTKNQFIHVLVGPYRIQHSCCYFVLLIILHIIIVIYFKFIYRKIYSNDLIYVPNLLLHP